jgi:pimeloyl-ACP methyl ester carboxylesterase
MTELAAYLERCGISPVECFDWSGGVFDAILAKDAIRYAERLLAAHRRRASIIAKSMGALVAEQALAIARDVRVDVLIRVGVPDRRCDLSLPNVRRIVDVTSSNDILARFAAPVLTPLLPKLAAGAPTPCDAIRLNEFSHRDLTSVATFDVYRTILTQAAETNRTP